MDEFTMSIRPDEYHWRITAHYNDATVEYEGISKIEPPLPKTYYSGFEPMKIGPEDIV